MHIATAFGIFGIVELIGSLFVVVGCAGEFWLLFNKNPGRISSLPAKTNWKILRRAARPFIETLMLAGVRFKLVGRVLSPRKEHTLERVFVMMVAFGVSLELAALPFSLNETAKISEKAEYAKLQSTQLGMEVEKLTRSNLQLQLRLKRRTINVTNIENFILITRNFAKFPVRVGIGEMRSEAFNFAFNIRNMLTQAGYSTPDEDTNMQYGIVRDTPFKNTWYMDKRPSVTGEWPDIVFLTDISYDFSSFNVISQIVTNGFVTGTIKDGDTNNMYGAFIYAMRQIGITAEWYTNADFVGTNHFAIFVVEKPQ